MAAEWTVIEIELVPDLLVDRLRNADGTGSGERFEPSGDVDAIAEDVVAVDDDVAEIDADPQLETAVKGYGVVDRTRRSLHLDRAAERVDDTRKIRQQAVARSADDPPAMRRDQRVDGAAELAERSMRARFIHTHQPAETDHIRMQNGGELPFPRAGFQDLSHRSPENEASHQIWRASQMRLTSPQTTSSIFDGVLADHGKRCTPAVPGEEGYVEGFLFLD
jgi:hypothetical protein